MKKCACLVASLVAQTVKNLPAMWEIWVQSLGWGDSLEESMATHSSFLAQRIPNGQRSLVGYSLWGRKESDMIEHLNNSKCIGIGESKRAEKGLSRGTP